jgi:hypothetical protein
VFTLAGMPQVTANIQHVGPDDHLDARLPNPARPELACFD